MPLNRRTFLKLTSVAAAAGHSAFALAPEQSRPADRLNPTGIKVAGIKMLPVNAGKNKVWTKKVGDGAVKVLLLHGGPAFTHAYLEAFESFLPEAGIEFYYYDQLGCGNSDIPQDPSFWNLPRFLTEVEEVRQGLGLDRFVLYGHSWGGILALEYALHYQQHLRGLIISNMTASSAAYLKHMNVLKKQMLPQAKVDRLNELESKQAYASPEYESIIQEDLYPQMLCRLQPWPEPVTRSIANHNDAIYTQMQGKSEFEVTGNLKTWDRWSRLHEIRVKTLTIGSKYDEMDPDDMRKMSQLVQNGLYAFCPNGSHLCMWDDQAIYFRQLLAFLRTV